MKLNQLLVLMTGAFILAGCPETDDTDTDSDTDTDTDVDMGLCPDMIECEVAAGVDDSATTAMYGADGTCWLGVEAEMDDCRDYCSDQVDAYRTAFPEFTECAGVDCEVDDDGNGLPDIIDDNPGEISDGDYSECAPYGGDTIIMWFPQPECVGTVWGYTIETLGLTGGAELFIAETHTNTPWEGEGFDGTAGHLMDPWDYDSETGWWESSISDLDVVSTTGDVVLGSTTLFTCARNDTATLAFLVAVYEPDDPTTVADCVIRGDSKAVQHWEDQNWTGCYYLGNN